MPQFTISKITVITDNWLHPNLTEYWILDASGTKAAELYDADLARITCEALNYCFQEDLMPVTEKPVARIEIHEPEQWVAVG